MELRVQNIGKIKKATLELKGVTVITGYNSTGKSSICKALYGIVNSYSDINRKVYNQRRNSMISTVYKWRSTVMNTCDIGDESIDYLTDHISDFIIRIEQISDNCITIDDLRKICNESKIEIPLQLLQELMDGFAEIIERDKEEYIRYIVSREIKNIFANQIGHVNFDFESNIDLTDNNRFCNVTFKDGELAESSYKNIISMRKPIYIEPESILDNCERLDGIRYMRRKEEPVGEFLFQDGILEYKLSLEEYEKREKNIKVIKEILNDVTNGHLVKNQETKLSYAESGLVKEIACKNIASGLKPFLMIQRMVENGSLDEGRLLIIDEPEVNQHPAWQLKFAKVLVLLNKELNIQVVISTHSPYFLKAVDYYMDECQNSDNGRYYMTRELKNENDLYTLIDVTDNKEKIYKTMYKPLEDVD
jgi:predicted ATPase